MHPSTVWFASSKSAHDRLDAFGACLDTCVGIGQGVCGGIAVVHDQAENDTTVPTTAS